MASLWKASLPYYIGGAGLAITLSIIAIRKITQMREAKKIAARRATYPANTVILNQFPRGPYAPNLSPFPIKLETFLRMADIPYQNQFDMGMSSKQKNPWMTYNGEDVADSQFCIDYLKEKLGKDMDSYLTKEEKATARAFEKMVDEHLYWVLLLQRWVYSKDYRMIQMTFNLPQFILKQISKKLVAQAHGQGIGRHTKEEVMSLGRGDLKALSDFLGEKPYLMGDRPSEVDCSVFGMLSQIKWQLIDNPLEKMVDEDFHNLSDYCERMKDRFWPDWDECNTAGGTREATK